MSGKEYSWSKKSETEALTMPLSQSFAAVRPSVVAFMPLVTQRSPDDKGQMFPIVGTGVILDDGLVVTNAHVVDALLKLPRPPNFPTHKFPFTAVLFHSVKAGDNAAISEEGIVEVPLEVGGLFTVEGLIPTGKGVYYGPEKPDFNIVRVKAKGLPRVELEGNTDKLMEGVEVGTIGYPMGTDALRAPGWVHQFGPFLQRGIISAILPARCNAPHSFVINLLSLGGASGSPVFLADSGHVIGILNSGLIEARPTFSTVGNQLQVTGFTQGATNFTYVVPAYYIASAVRHIARDKEFALPSDTPSLTEIIARSSVIRREGSGQIRPLPDKGDSPTVFDVHVEPVSFT
jgi:hypothetical protein